VSGPWEVMFSRQAMEFIQGLPKRERTDILAAIDHLARHPVLRSDDLEERDDRGRVHHLRFAESYVIVFWLDHGERMVNVMKTRRQLWGD